MENQQVDQAERIAALDLMHSYIVQAPAGSGKTELLIQRYLRLLAHCHAPEEVLAITFTKKAALEMHFRVLQALELASQTSSPSERHKQTTWMLAQAVLAQDAKQQWGVLNNPHRLRIMTMDAFCAALVNQAPFKAMLGDHVEMLEGDEVYIQAVRELFDSLQSDMPWVAALKQILLHLDNQYNLAETL